MFIQPQTNEMIVRKSVKIEVIEVRTNEVTGTTRVETTEKTIETVQKEPLLAEESADIDGLNMDDSDDFDFEKQSIDKPDPIGEPRATTLHGHETEQPSIDSQIEDPVNQHVDIAGSDEDADDLFLDDDSIDPNA